MEPARAQLAKLQELWASIYLSSSERNNYFAAPEESARAYGLSREALNQMGRVQKGSIDFYATSLKRKRFQEITQFIPTTARYWNGSLRANFGAYSEKWIPAGPKKHIADLISFSHYLMEEDLLPAEAKDCLRFELMPWDMNFRVDKKEHTYKSSRTPVRIAEAHRRFGWNFKAAFYRVKSRLGIYLKLPYLSKLLEWHLPLPLR